MFKILNEIATRVDGLLERIKKSRAKNIVGFLRHESTTVFRYQNLLFWLGLFVFIFFQTGLVVNIYNNRVLPPEVDDAYSYIGKAAQLDGCFFQDCPALETLRAQLSIPSSDLSPKGTSFLRERASYQTLVNYHPLHSLLLFLIFTVMGSWEIAFQVLAISGSIFLAFAIAFWLRHLFGATSAGIALILLSNFIFPGQGIAHIVPSNLTLGLFLMLWALILNPDNKYSEWVLLFGSVALLGMHTIGKPYVFILVFLYWLEYRNNLSVTKKVALVLAFSLTLTAFLLPQFIDHPLLAPFPGSFSENYARNVDMYKQELTTDVNIVKNSLFKLGGGKILFVLFLTGILYLNKRNFQALIVVTGFAIISIIGSFPNYPGTIFQRVWGSLVIIITGYIAQGYWRILLYAVDAFVQTKSTQALKSQWFVWLGIASVLWLFGANLYTTSKANMETRLAYQERVIARHDYWFDRKQTDFIKTLSAEQCGDILYFSEAARGYFLTHGALSCGAIDYLSVINSPEETKWLVENPNLNFAVFFNPIIGLSASHNGGILLKPGGRILISSTDGSPIQNPVYLLFDNPGKKVRLEVGGQPGSGDAVTRVVKSGGANWIAIPTNGETSLFINSADTQNQVTLRGIRSGDAATELLWPWNSKLMLTYLSNGTGQDETIKFEMATCKNLLSRIDPCELEVLMDNGDTILVGINR